jgi:hypothetical protein
MQLLIHGGLFKTGSTFIQNTFFENRRTLLREGVIYPETGLRKEWGAGHRHLELLKSLQMEGASSLAWRHLKEEVERTNVQRCVKR